MKHKVSELEGALLDAAVAKAEGVDLQAVSGGRHPVDVLAELTPDADPRRLAELRAVCDAPWSPSTSWEDGGPIIERERIDVVFWGRKTESRWRAAPLGAALIDIEDWGTWQDEAASGPTPLIAAMRAYVASKFADEIELPCAR